MTITVTIIGCGGSDGVPQIDCKCFVCSSNDEKNIRTRSSILITIDDFNILIDTSPDLKHQAIRENLKKIDAVIYTHAHYDHIGGLGDLKLLTKGTAIPMFADKDTIDRVKQCFEYAFRNDNPLYPPLLTPMPFYGDFSLIDKKITIIQFKQLHGKHYSYGFRIGDFAYSTDVSYLPEECYEKLKGVKIWVIDCVRYYESPTHFCIEDTVKAINKINPEISILTHMCHEIDYYDLSKILPNNIVVAYDGMKVNGK